jgi:hypothetical protein
LISYTTYKLLLFLHWDCPGYGEESRKRTGRRVNEDVEEDMENDVEEDVEGDVEKEIQILRLQHQRSVGIGL